MVSVTRHRYTYDSRQRIRWCLLGGARWLSTDLPVRNTAGAPMSEVQTEPRSEDTPGVLLEELKTTMGTDLGQIKATLSHIAGRLSEDTESDSE